MEEFDEDIILSEEMRQDLLEDFNKELKEINITKDEIKKLSRHICQISGIYKDFIFPYFLESILKEAKSNKKIDYLYLIIDIIIVLLSNKDYQLIKKYALNKIFPYFKEICSCFHYSLKDEDIEIVKSGLNQLKRHNIYEDGEIDELMIELRLTTEPNIMGDNNDCKVLIDMLNKNIFKVPEEIMNLYNEVNNLNKIDDNIHRANLLKKENDIIKNQIEKYKENLKQIKIK